jgi:hypothetical protein
MSDEANPLVTVLGSMIRSFQNQEFSQQLEPPQSTPQVDKPKSILLEAEGIVNGSRASDYGPSASFNKMASVYNTLFDAQLQGVDFIRMLLIVKLVRESFKHKRDNLVDLSGYAELLNRLEE